MHQSLPTVADTLDVARRRLGCEGVPSARRDAEVLLGHVLNLNRAGLIARSERVLSAAQLVEYESVVARRARREPIAYILGQKEFWSLQFEVKPGVLIPRPETECLIEACLAATRGQPVQRILEIGAGSGAIIVALAWEIPQARCVATDVSPSALSVAARNIERHHLTDRIELRAGSLFQPLQAGERFDVIVSNPPYIPSSQAADLMPDVRDYEPKLALFGGDDGLEIIRPMVQQAADYLNPNGVLAFELGADQASRCRRLLADAGFSMISIQRDYAGLPRVALARR